MVSLACSEDCPYLRDAREVTVGRRSKQLVAHLIAQGKKDFIQVIKDLAPVIARIEEAIVKVQRQVFHDLTDKEVLEGVGKALKTYETLQRGVIYEHRSESPRIQAVTNSILNSLDEIKGGLQQEHLTLRTGDVVACLRLVSEAVNAAKDDNDEQAYVRTAALFQPYPKKGSRLIIVPG